MSPRRVFALALLTCLTVSSGCSCSRLPPPPDWPELDPGEAARLAIEQYDTDSDGRIGPEELKASPPLTEAMETMDADGDGALTEEEIRRRVQAWLDSDTVVVGQSTKVAMDGKPLEGATVTYEPEAFLGPAYEATSGVTDEDGVAEIAGPDPEYPGLHLGVYRVRISKKSGGAETIPARYNAETTLAKEVAPDAPSTHRLFLFELQSR